MQVNYIIYHSKSGKKFGFKMSMGLFYCMWEHLIKKNGEITCITRGGHIRLNNYK